MPLLRVCGFPGHVPDLRNVVQSFTFLLRYYSPAVPFAQQGAVRYQELIGNTPMVDLTSLCSPQVPGVQVGFGGVFCLLLLRGRPLAALVVAPLACTLTVSE